MNHLPIRLLGDEPITNIVDLTTGQHAVLQVNQHYLVKQSASRQALEREAVGLYLFGRLSSAVPHLITQNETSLTAECLPNAIKASVAIEQQLISQPQIETFVATFMAKVYWKYQKRQHNLKLFPFLQWHNRLLTISDRLDQHASVLTKVMSSTNIGRLQHQLSVVANISEPLTLLHRDIHLDNILISFDHGYPRMMIIDVEHCMEGPIELELQNALIWHDQKSLNVTAIRGLLQNDFRIPFSSDRQQQLQCVYLADQLILAAEQADIPKLQTLVSMLQQ